MEHVAHAWRGRPAGDGLLSDGACLGGGKYSVNELFLTFPTADRRPWTVVFLDLFSSRSSAVGRHGFLNSLI